MIVKILLALAVALGLNVGGCDAHLKANSSIGTATSIIR